MRRVGCSFLFINKRSRDDTQSKDQDAGQGEGAVQTQMCAHANLMPASSEELIDGVKLCDHSGVAGHKSPLELQVAFVDGVCPRSKTCLKVKAEISL